MVLIKDLKLNQDIFKHKRLNIYPTRKLTQSGKNSTLARRKEKSKGKSVMQETKVKLEIGTICSDV